ncbi:T9SS type A sorting domain-containing protein [Cryomorphaceae bacterium 1068]|nr:T9SS type A sorting domain-containing protein [Cryomorphaceae bacterium 1068]
MRSFALILASLFLAQVITAQEYQMWYTHQDKMFKSITSDPGSGYRGVKVESYEVIGEDTVMTLSKAVQAKNAYEFAICFSIKYGWAGHKVIYRSTTGEHWITNMYGDSTFIKAQAEVGEIWPCFQSDVFGDARAEVLSISDSTFLGIQDSVKTIRFGLYNSDTDELISEIGRIHLSKHHGLISTLSFTTINAGWWDDGVFFTALFAQEPYYGFQVDHYYELVGISNANIGLTNLTEDEIYDFQEGDILHVVDEYEGGGLIEIREIVQRIEDGSEVSYVVDGASIYYSGSYLDPVIEGYNILEAQNYSMTLGAWLYPEVDMDALPGTIAATALDVGEGPTSTGMHINESDYRVKTTRDGSAFYYLSEPSFMDFDTCYYYTGGGGYCDDVSDVYSIEGLGGPYMECDNFSVRLVYYLKGGQEFGAPLGWEEWVLSAEALGIAEFNVFPNPASDHLYLLYRDRITSFSLATLSGKLIQEFTEDQITGGIDLSELSTGFYLYAAYSDGGLIKRGKLIIAQK